MTAAQKREQAAEKAVADAMRALINARQEIAGLMAQEADIAASIEQAVADSVRTGKPVDVADARQHLRGIVDQRETAQTVAATLEQVVRERQQELAAARVADFPELRSALVKRAETIAERMEEIHRRYAAELAPLDVEAGQLGAEWDTLRQTLPRAVTGTFRLDMVDLKIPNVEPHQGLAQFDPSDPSLPAWLGPVIEQSRRLVEQANPPVPLGVPVSP
jgi:hypothetical protein